jgi:hypothetical protein
MREIRSKLGEKYAKAQNKELEDLKKNFGHLKIKKDTAHTH